jgi:mannitol-1-phosphate/altronate dehydrogenase
MKQQIGFLDLTPTWQGILPVMVLALTNGTPTGQRAAQEELARMADAADKWNAHAGKLANSLKWAVAFAEVMKDRANPDTFESIQAGIDEARAVLAGIEAKGGAK